MVSFRLSVDPVQYHGVDCDQYCLYVTYPCKNGVQEICSFCLSLDEFKGVLEGVIKGLALSGVFLTEFRLIAPNSLLSAFSLVLGYCMEDCDAPVNSSF